MVDRGWTEDIRLLFPGDEYEADWARRRASAENWLRRRVPWFLIANGSGLSVFFAGNPKPPAIVAFSAVLVFILMALSFSLALRSLLVTLLAMRYLSWLWRVLGLVPWGIICGEAIVYLVFNHGR